MPLGHADVLEATVASIVSEQKGRYSGGVGLEREHHEIKHHANMLAVIGRDAFGTRILWARGGVFFAFFVFLYAFFQK